MARNGPTTAPFLAKTVSNPSADWKFIDSPSEGKSMLAESLDKLGELRSPSSNSLFTDNKRGSNENVNTTPAWVRSPNVFYDRRSTPSSNTSKGRSMRKQVSIGWSSRDDDTKASIEFLHRVNRSGTQTPVMIDTPLTYEDSREASPGLQMKSNFPRTEAVYDMAQLINHNDKDSKNKRMRRQSTIATIMELKESYTTRRRCLVVTGIMLSLLLGLGGMFWVYTMIRGMAESATNPVRSSRENNDYRHLNPAIIIFPGRAHFVACEKSNETSRISYMQDLNEEEAQHNVHMQLVHNSGATSPHPLCEHLSVNFTTHNGEKQHAFILKGPSAEDHGSALHIHLISNKPQAFYSVQYTVFHDWHLFRRDDRKWNQELMKQAMNRLVISEIPGSIRMWAKLSLKINHKRSGEKEHVFHVSNSLAKFGYKRDVGEHFFALFEWEQEVVEEVITIHTMTPSAFAAGIAGIFLTLHKAFQLLSASIKKAKEENEKRKQYRKSLKMLAENTMKSCPVAMEKFKPNYREIPQEEWDDSQDLNETLVDETRR